MTYVIAVVVLCGFGLVWSLFRPDMPFMLLAGSVALLLVELFSLRRRISRLEHKLDALASRSLSSDEPQSEMPPITLEFDLDEQEGSSSPIRPTPLPHLPPPPFRPTAKPPSKPHQGV